MFMAALNVAELPALSQSFINSLNSLGNRENDGQFINRFGTHWVTEIHMGSKYGYSDTFTQDAYESLASQGVNVKASASGSYMGVTAKVTSATDIQSSNGSKYKDTYKETSTFSIGRLPPATQGDINSWMRDSTTNPMPIAYSLDTLDSLVEKYPEYSSKAGQVREALRNYCSWLQGRGTIRSNIDCTPPPPANQAHMMDEFNDALNSLDKGPSDRLAAKLFQINNFISDWNSPIRG